MPDAKVTDMKGAEAIEVFSADFVSEELWAVWPALVRWNLRLLHRLHLLPGQFVIGKCPGIGKTGGIRIPAITNGCGFIRALKVIPVDRSFAVRRKASCLPQKICRLVNNLWK